MLDKYRKCIIEGCNNTANRGRFEGALCKPCYDAVISVLEDIRGNSVFGNGIKATARQVLKEAKYIEISKEIDNIGK